MGVDIQTIKPGDGKLCSEWRFCPHPSKHFPSQARRSRSPDRPWLCTTLVCEEAALIRVLLWLPAKNTLYSFIKRYDYYQIRLNDVTGPTNSPFKLTCSSFGQIHVAQIMHAPSPNSQFYSSINWSDTPSTFCTEMLVLVMNECCGDQVSISKRWKLQVDPRWYGSLGYYILCLLNTVELFILPCMYNMFCSAKAQVSIKLILWPRPSQIYLILGKLWSLYL